MKMIWSIIILSAFLFRCQGDDNDKKSCDPNCDTGLGAGGAGGGSGASAVTAGGTISFSGVSSSGFTVTWPAASDQTTAQELLKYKVVIASTAAEIDTLEEALAITGSGVLLDWTAGATSVVATNLQPQVTYAVAVLVINTSSHLALYTPETVTTSKKPATAGGAITITQTYGAAIKASWAGATGGSGTYQYACAAATTAAAVDTVDKVVALSTGGYSSSTSCTITGLTGGTVYYVGVAVKDSASSPTTGAYTPVSTTTLPKKKMFLSNQGFTGDAFGGVSGADSWCMQDNNLPAGGSTYKALISDASTRRACTSPNCSASGISEQVGWVLKPYHQYIRSSDGAHLATTNANGIFSSASAFVNPLTAATNIYYWTGLTIDWLTSDNCTGWTSSAVQGMHGLGDSTTAGWSDGSFSCVAGAKLLCVEQ